MTSVVKISHVLVGVDFDDASASALKGFGAIVQVLKACVHPVLFVPSVDGIFERSSS